MLIYALGCGTSARDLDCAEVRTILEAPQVQPRRTYDYGSEHKDSLPPIEQLRRATWRDDEVREAVQAMVEEAGPVLSYSPYRTAGAPPSAADRVAELCGLPRMDVIVEP